MNFVQSNHSLSWSSSSFSSYDSSEMHLSLLHIMATDFADFNDKSFYWMYILLILQFNDHHHWQFRGRQFGTLPIHSFYAHSTHISHCLRNAFSVSSFIHSLSDHLWTLRMRVQIIIPLQETQQSYDPHKSLTAPAAAEPHHKIYYLATGCKM